MSEKRETKLMIFPWVDWNSNKLEKWLEAKEADGWHLVSSHLRYGFRFERGKRSQVRYVADYPAEEGQTEYRTLCQDAGWQLVQRRHRWHLWRQEYAHERPEFYSDRESLIVRNKRMIGLLSSPVIMNLLILINHRREILSFSSVKSLAFAAIIVCLTCIVAGQMLSLWQRNQQLKAQGGR